ncbi:MAG: DUF1501 domain-containing protein [Verrucomicrobia bacterium]|nr:DUF1501 domain-containing protein [Verrucomicrobiota bacterium]MBI3869437.1 DUF1501 domain-containing protein [Verrucomicrobiota bacterium]
MSPDSPIVAPVTRREMLRRCGAGFGWMGLSALLAEEAASGQGSEPAARTAPRGQSLLPMAARASHFPGQCRQVVHLFMNGGPSQVDTFDPKPALDRYHGKPVPSTFRTERKTGAAMRSPFRFKNYGRSGVEVSELFHRTAAFVDDMAVIRSMQSEVPNHEPSLMLMNCGDSRLPRPSMGSWVTYGLGSLNQNLPGFLVLCPGGYPIVSTQNWRSAFLPGAFQGTYIDTQHQDIDRLIANIRNPRLSLPEQREQMDLLAMINRRHAAERENAAPLEARIQTFELAYRMQTESAEAFDVSREPESMQEAYGKTTNGRQLLITRRLLERGVRFIQVWSGAGQPWDNHENLEAEHRRLAGTWDQPIAAFLGDLKQRGMLDSTLVLWGGEFGRTPVAELPALSGRDHNHYGFSVWMAGGGVKGGTVHGATDDFGFQAVDKPTPVHDLHATILHLLGLDHERLVYRYAGRDFRLTDVSGRVIREVVA